MPTKDLLLLLPCKAKLFALSENKGRPEESLGSLHMMVVIKKNSNPLETFRGTQAGVACGVGFGTTDKTSELILLARWGP